MGKDSGLIEAPRLAMCRYSHSCLHILVLPGPPSLNALHVGTLSSITISQPGLSEDEQDVSPLETLSRMSVQ